MGGMKVLSFDIETKPLNEFDRNPRAGLDPDLSEVTVACTYDGTESVVYHFCKPAKLCTCRRRTNRRPKCVACTSFHTENIKALFAAMDAADRLCGYNCIRFDIAFLQRKFMVDNDRVARWVYKCTDLFFFISEVLDTYCKLDRLLRKNGLQTKSGSGKEAITMAFAGRWDDLAAYCSMDAALTYQLTMMPRICVPAYGNTTTVVVDTLMWDVLPDHDARKRKQPSEKAVVFSSRALYTNMVNSVFE